MLYQYLKIFYYLSICLILAILLFFLSYLFAKQSPYSEKLIAYECGFNPYDNARKVFDIRFYIVAILFLIFDLETALLFPWVASLKSSSAMGYWCGFEFMFELVIGYIYIWNKGALEWE